MSVLKPLQGVACEESPTWQSPTAISEIAIHSLRSGQAPLRCSQWFKQKSGLFARSLRCRVDLQEVHSATQGPLALQHAGDLVVGVAGDHGNEQHDHTHHQEGRQPRLAAFDLLADLE